MERLFYNKKIAVLIVAAIVVLVLLLCILLTFLTQLPSLRNTKAELIKLVDEAKKDEAAKQKLIEYRKTNEYVIEWAISMKMIPDDVINYIHGESDK